MSDGADRTLRQLAIRHLIIFGVGTLVLAAVTFGIARFELERALDRALESRMELARSELRSGGRDALVARFERLAQSGSHIGYVLLPRGSDRPVGETVLPRAPEGWGYVRLHDPDEERVDPYRTLTARLADGSTLTVLTDRDTIEAFDMWFLTFAALATLLLVAVALVGNVSLQRQLRRRLADATATARAVMEGDLRRRVARSARDDEFDALFATLNTMLDRVQRSMEEVRLMSSYITHDLRAPLAELAADLWRRRAGPLTTADCRSVLGEAAQKCEDINTLFSEILQIGEVDASRVQSLGKPQDLSELVQTLAEDHVAVAEDSGHQLRFQVDPLVAVFGIRELLAQVIVNLIENAFRHTPAGTTITVTLRRDRNSAILAIADDGPSLPPAERASLLDENRRSASGEFRRKAIGLKLVRAVVMAHGGTLVLLDNGPGLLVEMVLPTVG